MTQATSSNGHGGVRAGSATTNPEAEAALSERYARVVELRRTGMTFAQVAQAAGYADASGAYRAWRAALAAIPKAQADEARTEEDDRILAMIRGLWAKAARGDVWAVDRVLRLSESRRRLYGLDAPISVRGIVTSELDAKVNDLLDQMDALDSGDAPPVDVTP
jgi:hypothetical protein